jgi:hypothetical protein
MDPATQRAADDYHALLRDDRGLVEELEQRFFERMRQAKLTFGPRVLCAFLRPNFVSPALYDQIAASAGASSAPSRRPRSASARPCGTAWT